MICSAETHSVRTFTYTNDLYMDNSVSFGFTNFAIGGSDDMQLICFVEHDLHNNIHNSLKINGCVLKGVIY